MALHESGPGQADWPFSAEDGAAIDTAARALCHATLQDDHALAASLYLELKAVIERLGDKYGGHPALLETLADYTNDPVEQNRLYALAATRARASGLSTWTIALSWADALVSQGRFAVALPLLDEAAAGVEALGDDGDQAQHRELCDRCARELAKRE